MAKRKDSWSTYEDNILRQYYHELGVEGVQHDHLKTRSCNAIAKRAAKLGLCSGRQKAWTQQEDDVLRQYYPEHGSLGVHERLPDRTCQAIMRRAANLGVKTTYRDGQKLSHANTCGVRSRWNKADKNWR